MNILQNVLNRHTAKLGKGLFDSGCYDMLKNKSYNQIKIRKKGVQCPRDNSKNNNI